MPRKIAVTGCNGRVGKRVVKLALKRGNTVLGIDFVELAQDSQDERLQHPEFSFKKADLRDFDTVLALISGCDAIVHLAAYPNPNDYKVEAHNTNVVVSWNILRACAELGINHVAQASSVNVITMVYSLQPRFHYFPIDEDHPCQPDEPYGLSKLICEAQADAIVRRYSSMKVASLRLHWSVPNKSAAHQPGDGRANDLWGYVQEDSAADAFLLALEDKSKWTGHEKFFIVAPSTAFAEDTTELIKKYWPTVPIKEGKPIIGTQGLFDCTKAEKLLGWKHKD